MCPEELNSSGHCLNRLLLDLDAEEDCGGLPVFVIAVLWLLRPQPASALSAPDTGQVFTVFSFGRTDDQGRASRFGVLVEPCEEFDRLRGAEPVRSEQGSYAILSKRVG